MVERVDSYTQYLVCLCDTLSQIISESSTDSLLIIRSFSNWIMVDFFVSISCYSPSLFRVILRNEESAPKKVWLLQADASFVSMTETKFTWLRLTR